MREYFEQYNSFACARSAELPDVLGKMYDNQLATKGLLLAATLKAAILGMHKALPEKSLRLK